MSKINKIKPKRKGAKQNGNKLRIRIHPNRDINNSTELILKRVGRQGWVYIFLETKCAMQEL